MFQMFVALRKNRRINIRCKFESVLSNVNKYLLEWRSIWRNRRQTACDQVDAELRNRFRRFKRNYDLFSCCFVLQCLLWNWSEEHEIQDNSEWVNISLVVVFFFIQHFGWHVSESTNSFRQQIFNKQVSVQHTLFNFNKSEVDQFCFINRVQHYVLDFQTADGSHRLGASLSHISILANESYCVVSNLVQIQIGKVCRILKKHFHKFLWRAMESGSLWVLILRMLLFRLFRVQNLVQIQIEKVVCIYKKHIHRFAWHAMEPWNWSNFWISKRSTGDDCNNVLFRFMLDRAWNNYFGCISFVIGDAWSLVFFAGSQSDFFMWLLLIFLQQYIISKISLKFWAFEKFFFFIFKKILIK